MRRRLRAALLASGCAAFMAGGCGSPQPLPPRSDLYLIGADTPAGIRARKEVLALASPADAARAELLSLRLLALQQDDGSWRHDPTETGRALRDLYFLGVLPADDPDLARAIGFLLSHEGPYVTFEADSPAWGRDWAALYAVNLWQCGDPLKVRETVHSLLDNQGAWLDRRKGRAASMILRAIAPHALLADEERREALVGKLAAWQLPGGKWDLGPGTSQLAVLESLLSMAPDARVAGLINRFLPNIVSAGAAAPVLRDEALQPEEAHFVIVRALQFAGKLESLRGGGDIGRDLAQYGLALHLVGGPAESVHTLRFEGAPVAISGAPLLVGNEVAGHRPVLPPEPGKSFVRLFLREAALRKVREVLSVDPAVEAVLVLRGAIAAKGLLADMIDAEGLAIRGLDEENAAKLMRIVQTMENAPAPAADPGREPR
ncbi:MAG: hypothetical protein BWX69_02291 [Planctomycetes bacterium ADurb.Bin069]|nr:MAG: hypothetical protein BWX69_02291 [Planctomycetes bacterium ADurb.Bin069]